MPLIHVASACHRCLAGLFLLLHEASPQNHVKEFEEKALPPLQKIHKMQFRVLEYQLFNPNLKSYVTNLHKPQSFTGA